MRTIILTVKVLEKAHIRKEKKQQYVQRERDVMLRLDHPFIVRLYFTFQDVDRLCILHICSGNVIHKLI